jgi:hypothetical protein
LTDVLEIKWLSDDSDCDTCGFNYADGAEVTLDGEPLLELTPVAACYGGAHWSEADVYRKIIEKLGYQVREQMR